METDGETMSVVANLLDQVEQGRMPLEANGFVLLAEHIKYLFLFGDGRDGLIDDFELFEGLSRGMELPESAIDQDQAGHFPVFGLDAAIAALNGFAHAGEIVVAPFAANDEFAVIGFAHAAVFPHDHRGHGVCALKMGNIKALDAFRRGGKIQRGFERIGNGFRIGLEHTESLFERVTRILFHQIEKGMFGAALRHGDFHATVGQVESGGALGEDFLEELAVFEIAHDVNGARQVSGIEIELLQDRGEEFTGIEFVEIFPIKIAAIDDPAGADVKHVDGDLRRFCVPGENVGVVAGGGGDLLALFYIFEGAQEISVAGGLLVMLFLRSLHHARAEADHEVVAAALEKGASIVHGFGVFLVGNKPGDARAPTTLNVILEARPRVLTRQVHRAGGDAEMFVNEMDDAVGKAVREKWAEINRAVFAKPPGDVNTGIFFKRGEADVRISFVVAQQDVEFRLILLDEIIFQRQGFASVIDDDVVHIGDFANERAGLGIRPARLEEIGTHTGAQGTGFADIQNRP